MFRRAAAALLLIMMSASASADSVLVPEKTKVYETPSKSARSVSVSGGTMLEATGRKDGWIRVEKGDNVAWIPESAVEEVKEYDGAKGYVADDTALYKSYGGSKKLCTMPEDAQLKVYAVAGDWAYVQYDGQKGYAHMDDLTKKAPAKKEEKEEVEAEVEAQPEAEAEDGILDLNGMTAYARQGAKAYKSASTSSKLLGTLDLNDTVSVDAIKDDWARVEKGGKTAFMKVADLSTEKLEIKEEIEAEPEEEEEEEDTGVKAMDWFTSDIQSIFSRGTVATITDVATGISWQEVRKGGSYHADVQPVSAEDTAAMRRACGGVWSWDRRAIWVTIDGRSYAASMNSMPHGTGSIAGNDYDGHHCIHFTNSKGHGSAAVCPLHQAAIAKALKAA